MINNQLDTFGETGTVFEVRTGSLWPIRVKLPDIADSPYNVAELELVAEEKTAEDVVNHPSHYGGGENPYEVIKVAEAWGFDKDAYLFNVLKYIARAGKKGSSVEDLKKAVFYTNRKIARLEDAQ